MGYYLNLYQQWSRTGKLPGRNGLCYETDIDPDYFNLICPTPQDRDELDREDLSTAYWGSGVRYDGNGYEKAVAFTPFRQTILLFIAALAGELD